MRFLGTCPGNGIALRHGPHAGRLVVPLYFNNDRNWLAMCATVAYSDDHGETWRLSHGPNEGRETSDGQLDPQIFVDETWSLHEATVVERQDGTLLLFMRNQHPHGRVAVSESHDAGQTWGTVRFDEDLPEIWCQPNAIRLPSPEDEGEKSDDAENPEDLDDADEPSDEPEEDAPQPDGSGKTAAASRSGVQ